VKQLLFSLVGPLLGALLAVPAFSGCDGPGGAGVDGSAQASLPGTVAGCGVTLDKVALYQGVEVVLGQREASRSAAAQVIADRPGLLRVFVTPGETSSAIDVSARLTVASPSGGRSLEVRRTLAASSAQGDLGSSLNFPLSAEDLAADATISLELATPAVCPDRPAARFPEAGTLALRPLHTGTLKVMLVPIRYDSDGSGRLPDTSPEQLERFRGLLQAIFPVAAVELQVHSAMATTVAVSAQGGWSDLLETVRDLRAADAPADDVYYYGLVEPAPSSATYCLASCIGGISYVAGSGEPGMRAGVGVGYPGLVTAESLAHELGHAHGRPHAPCGPVNQPDPSYPYAGADDGGWGLDGRGAGKLEPPDSKDLMSYCSPRWISDYTFQALARRSAEVNGGLARPLVAANGPVSRWRILLVDRAGQARWGLEAAGAPPGEPVSAEELDDAGGVRGALQVWRAPLAEGDETAYWVPMPSPMSGGAVRLPGGAALSFAAPSSITPLGQSRPDPLR
jgi:hypothetical protein